MAKYSKSKMISLAGQLVEGVKPEHYQKWGKPGIRARFLDIEKRKLEMDFVLEGDRYSMHVLNAVSPALLAHFGFQSMCASESKQS